MNKNELDKIVDRGLIRLNEKAHKQQYEAQKQALIFPSKKTSLFIILSVGLPYLITFSLYSIGIKAPIFTLGFWTYPIFVLFMMFMIVINKDKVCITDGFLLLAFFFMILCLGGQILYEKFLNFVLESGYFIIIPIFNTPINLF